MADDQALRARRYRLHRQGDHRLCDPHRCERARDAAVIGVVVPPEDLAPGDTISGVLADVVRQLDYAPDDPRRVIIACAERIAAVLDEGAAPAQLVRELRGCLSDLERNPAGPAMPRDEFRARRHLRRLSMMLPGPEGPPAGHPAQHWVHGGG